MKNLWIIHIFTLGLFTFCSESDDPNPDDGLAIESDNLIGSWQVSRFIDDGEDETDDLDEFVLEFRENNDLIISRDSESITASWSLSSDGKTLRMEIDDDEADRIDPNDELEELDDDPWKIINVTSQSVELLEKDDDDQDELTLTRN